MLVFTENHFPLAASATNPVAAPTIAKGTVPEIAVPSAAIPTWLPAQAPSAPNNNVNNVTPPKS